ncbi:hypothetical protein ABT024_28645, partial [Streptomyces sp. NPDC002812]|uniref:hypothetical protein n=1 Tax=Streptomyces sp. NPDC002812 TaxID=3154434 RepID=UPI00331F8BF3
INFLALIFGTLLSSQGTDASFVLTLSGFPPGFRSVLFLRFRLYQSLSRLFSAFQVNRFRVFPFQRFQLYQIISVPCFSKVAVGLDLNWTAIGEPFPFGRARLYQVSLLWNPTRPHRHGRAHVCAGGSCEVET